MLGRFAPRYAFVGSPLFRNFTCADSIREDRITWTLIGLRKSTEDKGGTCALLDKQGPISVFFPTSMLGVARLMMTLLHTICAWPVVALCRSISEGFPSFSVTSASSPRPPPPPPPNQNQLRSTRTHQLRNQNLSARALIFLSNFNQFLRPTFPPSSPCTLPYSSSFIQNGTYNPSNG